MENEDMAIIDRILLDFNIKNNYYLEELIREMKSITSNLGHCLTNLMKNKTIFTRKISFENLELSSKQVKNIIKFCNKVEKETDLASLVILYDKLPIEFKYRNGELNKIIDSIRYLLSN